MILLNKFLEVAARDPHHLQRLNLTATHGLEALSILGRVSTFPLHNLEAIVDRTKWSTKLTRLPTEWPLHNVLIFGSMGHLVCGFGQADLEDLFAEDETAEVLLPIMGELKSCPSHAALQIMANKVSQRFSCVVIPH